jgi:cbb3-type cytochrome oxidase cytochrome c subunit
MNGEQFLVGIKSLSAPMNMVEERRPPNGGFLTRYLMPVVAQLDRQESGTLKGQESMGWLPPPLVGEGKKVQSDWLHDFLLEPYAIRPATYLRMPKFNMSSDEASKLAAYFAAVDNVEYPYTFTERRQSSYLADKEAQYARRLAELSTPEKPLANSRFTDALVIVSFNASCVKCHIIGDFAPRDEKTGQLASARGMAPDLTRVYQRLRPDYVREWIANPKLKLPYTAMPIVIPYDKGVSQDYYHGTPVEQLDAVVDLLMNFDTYAKGRTDLTKTLQELAPPAPPAAETPAAGTTPATGAADATAAPNNQSPAD